MPQQKATTTKKSKSKKRKDWGFSPINNYKLTARRHDMLHMFMEGKGAEQYGVVYTSQKGRNHYFPVMKVTEEHGTYAPLKVDELNMIKGQLESQRPVIKNVKDFKRVFVAILTGSTFPGLKKDSFEIQKH